MSGDAGEVAAVRRRVAPRGESIVGSFRSFSGSVAPRLAATLARLLEGRSDRVALLIGRGGESFAARLAADRPDLAGALVATGGLSPADASAHLGACDLAVQLYADGVTTRRGTLMAVLAHGVAAVTHAGHNTEPFWLESDALAVTPTADGVAAAAERLLADGCTRRRLGGSGRALYEARFSLARTVEALRSRG